MTKTDKILSKPGAVAIVFLLLNVIIITVLLLHTIKLESEKKYKYAYKEAANVVGKIADLVSDKNNISQAVAAHIEQIPNITQKEFTKFINSLLKNDIGIIKTISYSNDALKVSLIAPYNDENKNKIGWDLVENPERANDLQESIDNRSACVSGPLDLKCCENYGFVFFAPVWNEDEIINGTELLGVVDLVVPCEIFYEASGLLETDLVDFALKDRDSYGNVGYVFYGDATIFQKEDAIKISIKLPRGEWILAAYPKDGWNAEIPSVFIFFYFIAFLFSLITYILIKVSIIRIRSAEFQYRYIAENSMDLIWTLDFNSKRFTFVSDSPERLSGYNKEEYLQSSIYDMLLPTTSAEKFDAAINDAIEKYKNGETEKIELSLELQKYNKMGHLNWIDMSMTVTLDSSGNPSKIIGITRLIDYRKKLETLLKESESKHRYIMENTRDMIWRLDFNTMRYNFVSDSVFRESGYTKEEFLQMTMHDVYGNMADKFIGAVNNAIEKYKNGEDENVEIVVEVQRPNKDGFLRWVEISATAIIGSDGEPSEIIGTSRIIDDRKKLEALLQSKQKELVKEQLELKKVNKEKDRFFSIIAHDLKNPVGALLNTAEIFADFYQKMSVEEIEKNIKSMKNIAYHTYKLLENLLEWAKSTKGEIVYTPIKTDIIGLIQECVNPLKIQAMTKNININIPDIFEERNVICDLNMTNTIIRNLVSNAIKFSHNNSSIEINISNHYDNNYVRIDIKDSGVGIPPETINKLFRIDEKITTKGTNQETGTGLGLILCKEFVDKHNCEIWVESEPGKGTTFSFTMKKAE